MFSTTLPSRLAQEDRSVVVEDIVRSAGYYVLPTPTFLLG
jgi:hypothetical protein